MSSSASGTSSGVRFSSRVPCSTAKASPAPFAAASRGGSGVGWQADTVPPGRRPIEGFAEEKKRKYPVKRGYMGVSFWRVPFWGFEIEREARGGGATNFGVSCLQSAPCEAKNGRIPPIGAFEAGS